MHSMFCLLPCVGSCFSFSFPFVDVLVVFALSLTSAFISLSLRQAQFRLLTCVVGCVFGIVFGLAAFPLWHLLTRS